MITVIHLVAGVIARYFLNFKSKIKMTDEIKKRIKLLGLKKSHVANKIGASNSEFSHFLSGRRNLDSLKLTALKSYLGLK